MLLKTRSRSIRFLCLVELVLCIVAVVVVAMFALVSDNYVSGASSKHIKTELSGARHSYSPIPRDGEFLG
jgi:hypothetical protein